MIDLEKGTIAFAQSDVGTYLWCRRNFSWSVARRLVVNWGEDDGTGHKGGAREEGTLVHKGVELIRDGADDGVVRKTISSLARELSHMDDSNYAQSKDWAKHVRYATTMCLAWRQHLERSGEEVGITTLKQEERLWAPMGAHHGLDVTLTGKPDAIQYNENFGALAINDVKTVAKLTTVMEFNRQLMTYAIMYRALNPEDYATMLSTTQLIRQLKVTEKTPKLFTRTNLLITDEQWDIAWTELNGALKEMTQLAVEVAEQDMSRAFQNPSRDCDWKCDVKDLCDTYNRGGNVEHLIEFNYKVKENPFDY